ncbi:MAG: hypothetical protein AAF267_06440 [Deinococcota bacterium]
MKKFILTSLTLLAMALSLAPQIRQPFAGHASLATEYLLADGDTDADGG